MVTTREHSRLLSSGLEMNGITEKSSYYGIDVEGDMGSNSNDGGGRETEQHAKERLFDERNGLVQRVSCIH